MIDTVYTTLDKTPKALNGIDMAVTSGIFTLAMKYPSMDVSKLLNEVIAGELIGVDGILSRAWNVIPDDRQDSSRFNVLSNGSLYLTFITVSQSDYRSLALCTTSRCTGVFAADIGFIDFDMSGERIVLFIHQGSYLFEHSPCCLIGHSEFTFKLFSGDTATGRSHQEHSIEPQPERSSGFMKDCIGCRRNSMSAILADIIFRSSPVIMSRYFLAVRAFNALWIASLEKKLKTTIISRELLIEIFYGILCGFHIYTPFSIFLYSVYHKSYCMSRDSYLISNRNLDRDLNKYGQDGWLLVANKPDYERLGYHVVFAREIE